MSFLEKVVKLEFEEYMTCIRIKLFNGKILLAWNTNLDIQIVRGPYGCPSYIVGYISKSQRRMSAKLDATAAKEARKGNFDLKK